MEEMKLAKKILTFFSLAMVLLIVSGCATKTRKINSSNNEVKELCEILIDTNETKKLKSLSVRHIEKQNIGPFTQTISNDTLRESIHHKKGDLIIDSADTIDVKMYNGDYYIFENFENKKFDQAAIYLYKDDNVHEICSLRKDIELVAKDCYNEELCEYIVNNSRLLYTKKQDMLIDLNNDGVSEQLTFVNRHDKNTCDYETYLVDKTKDDVIVYLTDKLEHNFNKCLRSISFTNFHGLNYIIIENFDYEVTAFLIRDDKTFVAGTFDPQIVLKRIR